MHAHARLRVADRIRAEGATSVGAQLRSSDQAPRQRDKPLLGAQFAEWRAHLFHHARHAMPFIISDRTLRSAGNPLKSSNSLPNPNPVARTLAPSHHHDGSFLSGVKNDPRKELLGED
jgi:hypothetical protein